MQNLFHLTRTYRIEPETDPVELVGRLANELAEEPDCTVARVSDHALRVSFGWRRHFRSRNLWRAATAVLIADGMVSAREADSSKYLDFDFRISVLSTIAYAGLFPFVYISVKLACYFAGILSANDIFRLPGFAWIPVLFLAVRVILRIDSKAWLDKLVERVSAQAPTDRTLNSTSPRAGPLASRAT